MNYVSTRDKSTVVSSAQAILQGISREGGLFVPESLPALGLEDLQRMASLSYTQRAVEILAPFLTDFSREELEQYVEAAYGNGTFEEDQVAPLACLSENLYMLELWHGPTCAFKDVALQLLPHLMDASNKKVGDGKTIVILVATSGDTGKAALEGFKDVDGTKILVFYPDRGVSRIQKLQMQTQEGNNVGVAAVAGNFDDCQTRVKELFTDPEMGALLEKGNMAFSSANSINWGRLVPQIVYYVSAYCDLVAGGQIKLGEEINVSVPTGNFGNILAAYYAKQMGVPIKTLICASNKNNVLTDFIRTGEYDRNRPFYITSSPSMDILISSNLERLVFEMVDRDDRELAGLMKALKEDGKYKLTEGQAKRVQENFWGGFCTDEDAYHTLKDTFESCSYLCDTHTAVALRVYQEYVKETGDKTKTVIASTANPFKFAKSVLDAVGIENVVLEEFAQLGALAVKSGMEVPQKLAELKDKPIRFTEVVDQDGMRGAVLGLLGISE